MINIIELEKSKSFFIGENLGTYIEMKRKSMGYSLNQLAKITQISKSTLYKIEKNKIRNTKAVYLYRLSKTLNVDYELLLELDGYDIGYINDSTKFKKGKIVK